MIPIQNDCLALTKFSSLINHEDISKEIYIFGIDRVIQHLEIERDYMNLKYRDILDWLKTHKCLLGYTVNTSDIIDELGAENVEDYPRGSNIKR